jgi:hypothetical protein
MSEHDFRVPPAGPMPSPTPEHQRRITNNKWFEVVTVILMIVVGFGYLAWRNYRANTHIDPARTLSESAKEIEREGGTKLSVSSLFGRQVLSYTQKMDIFDCNVDLIGMDPDSPLETAIIWLTPQPGKWAPEGNSLLKAVNGVGELGQKLVKSSSEAMDKAAKTMELIGDTKRPHDKGVAATNDGWKITYVTYRGFDENADPPEAVLYYILQRMSAGEDGSLAVFNRTLYDAVKQGIDAKLAVQAASSAGG